MPSPISHVFCNGASVPAGDARISVFNPAIYGAWGVYESLQVANGVVFEPHMHLRRLAHSAESIELPLPADLETIGRWIETAAADYGAPACTVRLFIVGPDNGGAPAAYVWAQPPNGYPESYYREGATAVTFEARRYLPEAKSLNSLASFMAQRRARQAGVHEALLYHDGCLTEGSNSNLFAVLGDCVVTPPHTEILAGVTHDIAVRLMLEHGIPLRELELRVNGVGAWQECFITSTSRHVMPVTTIDGRPVGTGKVGPVTHRLHDLFEEYFVKAIGK